MTDFARLDAYVHEHLDGWLEELAALCRVPSVSARHEGIEECAMLVAELLRKRGFSAEVTPTEGGHPVVLANAGGARQDRHLLFYNHYDVQPPEPLELWQSPPFELTRRDGAVYARGAKDDKGEFMARLAALDALKEVNGAYPCRISWLGEGEEEIGSVHLPAWVKSHQSELGVGGAVWEEGGIDADGFPLITLGARGLLYVELSVQTISRDAHSGQANVLPNALWRLVWALAALKDPSERILIPGWYERVRPPTRVEEELLGKLQSQEETIKKEYGLERLLQDREGRDVVGAPFDPTANIAGLGGGYQGEGSKTVIPAQARCKIDFRLVPDQDPEDCLSKLRRHLDEQGFKDVKIEVLGSERPGLTPPDADLVRWMAETALEVYGKEPKITPLTGGTTPMYLFTERGVPVVAPGVGYGSYNRAHSPNEFMRIVDFENAIRHLARLTDRFAAGPS